MLEIPPSLLIRTFTFKRIWNAGKALAGFILSALTGKSRVWGQPFILTVEPTNLCNLRCPLCVTGNGGLTRSTGMMTLATFQQMLDEYGDYLFYLLLYHQGEPYLNKDFLQFVRLARQRNIFVTTSSNAHYFDLETARQTVESGLDSIIVSIDGATQKTYEKYRVGGNLEQAVAGIRNLVQEKRAAKSKTPFIYLQFIAMQHNEHEFAEIKKLGKSLGVDQILFKTAQVETLAQAKEWLPENESLRRYDTTGQTLQPKRIGKGVCPRPWTSSLMNYDGVFVPCCFDKNATHKTGQLNPSSSKNLYSSKEYEAFRQQMLKDRDSIDMCSNCSQGIRLYR